MTTLEIVLMIWIGIMWPRGHKKSSAILFMAATLLMMASGASAGDERRYLASVDRVIDGDTVVVSIDAYESRVAVTDTLRLYGFDTPELNSSDPAEREAAKKAKAEAQKLFSGHETVIVTAWGDTDKYGRTIASIEVGGIDFGDYMVSRGHAEPYGDDSPYHLPTRAGELMTYYPQQDIVPGSTRMVFCTQSWFRGHRGEVRPVADRDYMARNIPALLTKHYGGPNNVRDWWFVLDLEPLFPGRRYLERDDWYEIAEEAADACKWLGQMMPEAKLMVYGIPVTPTNNPPVINQPWWWERNIAVMDLIAPHVHGWLPTTYDAYIDADYGDGNRDNDVPGKGLPWVYENMIKRPHQLALNHSSDLPVYSSISHRIYGKWANELISLAEFAKHLDTVAGVRGDDGETITGFAWWLRDPDPLVRDLRSGVSNALLEYLEIIWRVLDPAAHARADWGRVWALGGRLTNWHRNSVMVASYGGATDDPRGWADPKSQKLSPDINRDGFVNTPDLLEILGVWGPVPDMPDGSCEYADTNRDGRVDVVDQFYVLAWWGSAG